MRKKTWLGRCSTLRIVFAADLHGDDSQYDEMSLLASDVAPDVLILGGDLFAYSREPSSQLAFARGSITKFLKSLDCRVLWIPGNVDWPDAVEYLDALSAEMQHVERLTLSTWRHASSLGFIGYPFIPPSPFCIKHWERRDLATDSLVPDPGFPSSIGRERALGARDLLQSLPSIEEDLQRISETGIWVIHTPPHGTGLDSVKAGTGAGVPGGAHVGSVAVRHAIERLLPVLTLHGHIHEAPSVSGRWFERIGRTIAINPGRGDRLHAVIVDVEKDGRVRRLQHTVYGEADLEIHP